MLWKLLLLLLATSGCGVLPKTSKYAFSDGYYLMKFAGHGKEKVYVDQEGEDYVVYRIQKLDHQLKIDTALAARILLPLSYSGRPPGNAIFGQKSFDVDFLTIPLKYRPQVGGFPRQLNANLNGGFYIGYRNDNYHLQYNQTPLGRPTRKSTHFGFSFGAFAGLGATAMNPSVTRDRVRVEYDGVVFTKGIAGIVGINNLTVGLAVGFDNLLDQNRKFWIYNQKPWVGLAFGLNLN